MNMFWKIKHLSVKIAALGFLKLVTGRILKFSKYFQRSKLKLWLVDEKIKLKVKKITKTISACTKSKPSKRYSSLWHSPFNDNVGTKVYRTIHPYKYSTVWVTCAYTMNTFRILCSLPCEIQLALRSSEKSAVICYLRTGRYLTFYLRIGTKKSLPCFGAVWGR